MNKGVAKFVLLALAIIVIVIVIFLFLGQRGEESSQDANSEENLESESQQGNAEGTGAANPAAESSGDIVRWDHIGGKWTPSRTPPECPPLVFDSPSDVNKASSVLYPGQYRGATKDTYKPHGGYRFDTLSNNEVEVRAPFDGYVWRGSRYLASGEIQYVFDIVHSCGIMNRFGHLLELSPEFQDLASKFPEPKEGDSRDWTTEPIPVKKGDLIATKVGVTGNVFYDWGVYDFRKENEASKSAAYREEHSDWNWAAFNALCWLDYLPPEQQEVVKSLPAGDGVHGKTSDYC